MSVGSEREQGKEVGWTCQIRLLCMLYEDDLARRGC